MTKKKPRSMKEIEDEADSVWRTWKELNAGKYKQESSAFRRDLRSQCKKKLDELYNEMADRDMEDYEERKRRSQS